jgi:transketolase
MEDKYSQIALGARRKVLEMLYKAQTSHIGSNFSCIDIMTVVFSKINLEKDRFVLSKGWAAASLYYFLHRLGKITDEQLDSYCMEGSEFIGLAEPIIPEIMIAGGSMGLGLPGAVGLALSKKLKKEEGKVYCIMSDGEMQIGTTWECALIARQHNLSNLIVIVDNNKLQAMGKVSDILDIEPLASKWHAFGWRSQKVDGHNTFILEPIMDDFIDTPEGGPAIIIADTVKGKGVPFMENNNLYHYKQLSEKEYNEALQCLK